MTTTSSSGSNTTTQSTHGHQAKIMVVDDDVRLRDLLRRYLTAAHQPRQPHQEQAYRRRSPLSSTSIKLVGMHRNNSMRRACVPAHEKNVARKNRTPI